VQQYLVRAALNEACLRVHSGDQSACFQRQSETRSCYPVSQSKPSCPALVSPPCCAEPPKPGARGQLGLVRTRSLYRTAVCAQTHMSFWASPACNKAGMLSPPASFFLAFGDSLLPHPCPFSSRLLEQPWGAEPAGLEAREGRRRALLTEELRDQQ